MLFLCAGFCSTFYFYLNLGTMEHKKLRAWTQEEDEIIKYVFPTIPFSSHGKSRFVILNHILCSVGYTDRTPKAISRRSYRLGLRSYTITKEEETKQYVCSICGKKYTIKKRHANNEKIRRCSSCREEQTKKYNGYVNLARYQSYRHKYMSTYRK